MITRVGELVFPSKIQLEMWSSFAEQVYIPKCIKHGCLIMEVYRLSENSTLICGKYPDQKTYEEVKKLTEDELKEWKKIIKVKIFEGVRMFGQEKEK